jgi:hypothetical protein
VEIDDSAVAALAKHIKSRPDFSELARSKWDDPRFWNVGDTPARRSQYFTIGNAINFRFWKLIDGESHPASGSIHGERFVGSMYLWRSLKRCLDEDRCPVLDASFLATLSLAEFDLIFSDDEGRNPLSIAAADRIENLRDLGVRLEAEWGGVFFNLVQQCSGRLKAFAELSSAFRAFDDPNFKLTMVNAILHSGSGIVAFDSDPLPGIDYHLLKQLLRQGILRPQTKLAAQIETNQLLNPRDGQELRRVALLAMIRLSELSGIGGDILDNKWWGNRSKCTDCPVCDHPETAHECPFYGVCERLTHFRAPVENTRYY